jgi:uncharacterized repeat protein (TIGR04076 family)
MNIKDLAWQKIMWAFMKKRLRFNDAEIKTIQANPRNHDILTKAPLLMNKTIIAEVVDSRGCNSEHQIGDKIYFDGFGNLITALGPKRVCIHALHAITPQVFAANELIYAGVDPNTMRFNRAACFDVGVACGGFGQVVFEIKVQAREKIKKEMG